MQRETQVELGRRLVRYLDTGTTAMAGAFLQNPVSAYTSKERAARERAVLFRDAPLFLGLSCLVRDPGDYLTDDDSGTPILVVRARPGEINAFANICRHRGARVADGCGYKRVLTCPYHGWTYDLDGRLVHLPGEEGFRGLVREEHGLRAVPVVERHGLLWVRPAPRTGPDDVIDIDAHLGRLGPELASFGFERYHHFETRTLRPRINWKIAVDTFLEAYHLAALHERSVGPIFISNLCAADAFGVNHRMVAVRRSFAEMRARPEAEWDVLRHTIALYTLFPNTVFVYQADHVEVWRIFPDREREDACSVHLSLYVPEPVTTEPAQAHWAANLELALEAVDSEDFRLGEGMQRGFASGAVDHVTYGRNEPALIHFHRTLQGALDAAS